MVFKPLMHVWSLAIEEQFYLLWPLLLAGVAKKRGGIPILMLAVLGLSGTAWAVLSVLGHDTVAFYSPLTRFWELMVGCLLAYLTAGSRDPVARLQPATEGLWCSAC